MRNKKNIIQYLFWMIKNNFKIKNLHLNSIFHQFKVWENLQKMETFFNYVEFFGHFFPSGLKATLIKVSGFLLLLHVLISEFNIYFLFTLQCKKRKTTPLLKSLSSFFTDFDFCILFSLLKMFKEKHFLFSILLDYQLSHADSIYFISTL